METPDYWVILKLTVEDKTYYKVFASFVGGYLDGDRWRMNSGVVSVTESDDSYSFAGASGSVYSCRKGKYRTTAYTQQILEGFISHAYKANAVIEIMPEDTNWTQVEYGL
jgi:hypothetical protein